MERLTVWNERTEQAELIDWNGEEWQEFMGELDIPVAMSLEVAVDRLAEYEDAEEQGFLLRLPCKVGDIIWIKGDKFPAEILAVSLDEEGLFFEYVEYDRSDEITEVWDSGNFSVEDIGKTVFLTQAEAEKALVEME